MKLSKLTQLQLSYLSWRLDSKTTCNPAISFRISGGDTEFLGMDLVEVFMKFGSLKERPAKIHARKVINYRCVGFENSCYFHQYMNDQAQLALRDTEEKETRLAQLARAFRGDRDEEKRKAIAAEYAQVVKDLIKSGRWTNIPVLEDQLPDEWMPKVFMRYWLEFASGTKDEAKDN